MLLGEGPDPFPPWLLYHSQWSDRGKRGRCGRLVQVGMEKVVPGDVCER